MHHDNSTLAEQIRADLAFHEAICEYSGNETLLETWRSLIGRITIMVLNVGPERMTQLQDADAHRPLLEAIASGDEAIIRSRPTRHLRLGHARGARGGRPRRGPEPGRRMNVREVLSSLGLPGSDLGSLPTSTKRFADGAWYRVESRAPRGRAASKRCSRPPLRSTSRCTASPRARASRC